MLGTTLGNYRLERELGRGGMGAVFVGTHTLLGREAAIKVLLAKYSQDQDIVQRFFNEARAATAIEHPGIVEIYDYGKDASGCAYIVMELCQGESLGARIRRRHRFKVAGALTITRQIAGTLAAAHKAGIVHRDLKPDNVFVVPDPEVAGGERIKLLDFGIAKLATEAAGPMKTTTGVIMGTPNYMSPEQCRGAGTVDHRSDLYSLGCMLFELICGRVPFVGEGSGDIIGAHLLTPPPRPSELAANVPPDIERLILALLAKKAADRPASADEVIVELSRIADEIPDELETVPASSMALEPTITPVDLAARTAATGIDATAQGHAGAETPTPPNPASPPPDDARAHASTELGHAIAPDTNRRATDRRSADRRGHTNAASPAPIVPGTDPTPAAVGTDPTHAAPVSGTDPNRAAGTDPNRAAGTDPTRAAGIVPNRVAGTDPTRATAGTDPTRAAASPDPTPAAVGTDPTRAAGTDPTRAAGIVPNRATAGTDPTRAAGTDPTHASPVSGTDPTRAAPVSPAAPTRAVSGTDPTHAAVDRAAQVTLDTIAPQPIADESRRPNEVTAPSLPGRPIVWIAITAVIAIAVVGYLATRGPSSGESSTSSSGASATDAGSAAPYPGYTIVIGKLGGEGMTDGLRARIRPLIAKLLATHAPDVRTLVEPPTGPAGPKTLSLYVDLATLDVNLEERAVRCKFKIGLTFASTNRIGAVTSGGAKVPFRDKTSLKDLDVFAYDCVEGSLESLLTKQILPVLRRDTGSATPAPPSSPATNEQEPHTKIELTGDAIGAKREGGIDPPAPKQDVALTATTLRAALRAYRGYIQDCYIDRLVTEPKLATIVIDFTIDRDGHAYDLQSSEGDERLLRCIANVIGHINFPRPAIPSRVTFTQPFEHPK